jgi:AraC-like DNA-binding protein
MELVRIGLVFSYSFTVFRSIVRGIRIHAETRPNWLLTSVYPEERPLRTLGALKPHGLIAAVTTADLAQALRSWRRPFVNVSALLPEPLLPRVGVDNCAVGRLAADHFLERGLRCFGFVGARNWLYSKDRERGFRGGSAHVRLNVADVLKEVPVERRSLERRFRRHLGRGIGEEIRRVHVERAQRLLAETDLPIKDVAQQSGFSDFRQLAVVFRQELGLCPTEYRSEVRSAKPARQAPLSST